MLRPPGRRARSSLLYSPTQDEGHIKWPSLRVELAMNFVPAAREGAPLLMEGLISGYSMPGCIQSGTGFPDGRGLGKCVPEFAFGMGCSFRLRALVESVIRKLTLKWDAVSQRGHKRKPHPTPDVNSGTSFPRCACQAAFQHRGVCPATRNVRFIASSARAGEHLMCSPCEQDCPSRESYIPRRRADEPVKTRRYLILVVPGARLGSVSLASVWKCSV